MTKLEIVFEDFIGVVIQPTEDGFIITYWDDDYTIKNGETLSLKSGDLYFKAYTEEKEGEKMTLVELEDVFAFFIDWDMKGGEGYIGDIPTGMIIDGLKEWFEKRKGVIQMVDIENIKERIERMESERITPEKLIAAIKRAERLRG